MKQAIRRFLLPTDGLTEGELRTLGSLGSQYGRAWRIAWPAMLELIMVSLATVIDTAMVARMGETVVAAVGYTAQPRLICLAVIKSLNVGINAVIARRIGEKDLDRASACMRQGIVLSALISTAICGLIFWLADPILALCGSGADTRADGLAYFRWMVPGLIFQHIYLTINTGQSCSGNGKLSMRTNAVSCVVHIVFNYLLIGGNLGFPALGVRGAAIAGTLGNLAALCVAAASLLHKRSIYTIKTFRGWLPNEENTRGIWKVSGSALVENMCFRVGIFACALITARLGTLMYATNSVCMVIMDMFVGGIEGFAVAAAALVGRELGAHNLGRSELAAKISFRMALAYGVVVMVLMGVFRYPILKLFSDDPQVIASGGSIMLLMALGTIPNVVMTVYAGSLRGAGDTKFVARFSLLSAMLVRPTLSWLLALQLDLGILGMWYCIVLDFVLRGVLNYLRFRGGRWKAIEL